MADLKSLLSNFFTLDYRQVDWKRTAILALGALALFFWFKATFMPGLREVSSTEFRRIPQIRQVEKIKTVTVPGPKQLVVVEKESALKELEGVTQEIAADPAKQIAASAELPESRNGYQAIGVIDTKTGESHIEAREKPAPWFRLQNHGYVNVWYGYNHKLETAMQAEAAWKPIRIKNIYLGIKADVNSDGNARAMAGGGFEW